MTRLVKYLPVIAIFLLPLMFYHLVDKSSWRSNGDVHAMLEFASSLLAVTAGVMVLLHFFTTGRSFFLIISIGLVLIGAEEFIHAIFSFNSLWVETPANFKLAVSTTWLSGQFVLVTSLFIAFFSGERQIIESKRSLYAVVFNGMGAVFAIFVSFLIFRLPSLPDFVQIGSISKKLIELTFALLYFLAFIFYFRSYLKQQSNNPLLWSIIAFIILRALVHIFVFDSQTFYDAHWDTAHLLVLLSYFIPVFGIWGETIKLNRHSQLQLIELEKEMVDRKKAEEMLTYEKQRLANIIEGTNVGTWEWNIQTGETKFSERWAEFIGYTLEEISPVNIDTWIKYSHPEDLKVSNELLEKHFKGELDYYRCETRMLHKNGDYSGQCVQGFWSILYNPERD
jgi:PAS domain S-box-containing protein